MAFAIHSACAKWHGYLPSPVGSLLATAQSDGTKLPALTSLTFPRHRHPRLIPSESVHSVDVFRELSIQLGRYFEGTGMKFELPMLLLGTDFQKAVWSRLQLIPFGQTTSYRKIAIDLGKPNAVRAVGAAVGRNPISILVPCHRVVASSGALTGFAGGLDAKRFLLELERAEDRPLFLKRRQRLFELPKP